MMATFLTGCRSDNTVEKQITETVMQEQIEATKEEPIKAESVEEQPQTTAKESPNGVEEKLTNQDKNAPQSVNKEKQDTYTNVKKEEDKKQVPKPETAQSISHEQETASADPIIPTDGSSKEQENVNNQKEYIVSISIKADKETGVILSPIQVEYEPGETVLDVLKNITKEKRIQMEYRGRGGAAYIEGIQNLYEFDKGPKSGWMYKMNGAFMKRSAGAVEVKAGDQIEWLYTLDLGKDLE